MISKTSGCRERRIGLYEAIGNMLGFYRADCVWAVYGLYTYMYKHIAIPDLYKYKDILMYTHEMFYRQARIRVCLQ